MYCAECGRENPDVKVSRLAIVSLVLGILSVFTIAVTAMPAVILGTIRFCRKTHKIPHF
ncbi:MAG: DUF4190 domain-containing protein [Planctomycetota bacterium]|jgi:hypothetical protein